MDPTGEVRNMTVAEYVIQCLVDCGVTHVFGGHGAAVVPLIDAISARDDIAFVYSRCEVNAALTASAYAKLRNGLGCCLGTSGPGASHLMTGVLDASLDRVSMLCITGLKQVYSLGYGDFQDIPQAELFRAAGLAFSQPLMHKRQVIPLMRDAVASALAGFTCAHLAIPVDVQREVICPPPVLCTRNAGKRMQPTVSHLHYLANAARIIRACCKAGRQILLTVGQWAEGAGPDILALAERVQAPVVTTLDAKGYVRESHPLVLGVVGIFGNPGTASAARLIERADLVVSFGWGDHSQLLVGADGLQERLMIEFQPSAALVETRFQAVETVVGNVAFCCRHVTQLLATDDDAELDPEAMLLKLSEKAQPVVQSWVSYAAAECRSNASLFPAAPTHPTKTPAVVPRELTPSGYMAPEGELSEGYSHPGRVISQLSGKLGEGAVVCVDVGDVTLWTSLCCCLDKPGQRMLASIRLGVMGYSTCAAVAASSLRPDNQVVMITGDGGFQMSLPELATLRQLGARHVLIIVLVNGSLGRVVNEPTHATGCNIDNPDYVRLVEAYGGRGVRLSTADVDAIDQALDAGLGHEGLFLVEVLEEPSLAPLMAKRRPPEAQKRAELRRYILDVQAMHRGVLDELLPVLGPSPAEVHQGILFRPQLDANYVVSFHGHVDFVIQGAAPQVLLDTPVPVTSVRYGFEAGTALPGDLESIGEMLVVKGRAYTKCTNKARPDFYRMVSGNSIVSPAAGFVTPADAIPMLRAEYVRDGQDGRRFDDLLRSMLRTLQNRPFCAGGRVCFRKLRATALTKATIHQEDIFQHAQEYYQPELARVRLEDRAGYVFGFAADFHRQRDSIPYPDIRRVLYPGSSGIPTAGQEETAAIHFHVVILKAEFSEVQYKDLQPTMFDDIDHLDCASTVTAMELEVFPIHALRPHVPSVSDALPPFSTLNPDGSCSTRPLAAFAGSGDVEETGSPTLVP